MVKLSYTGRRVLAHLPVWAQDEAAHIAAEGGPDVSVRAYRLPEFTNRLLIDPGTPDMDEAKVEEQLRELAAVGLCKSTRDGWRMTKKGFEALVDPTPEEDQEPGPAVLELHPAQMVAGAETTVSA